MGWEMEVEVNNWVWRTGICDLQEEFPILKFLEGSFTDVSNYDEENSGPSVEMTKRVLEPVSLVNKRIPKIPKQVFVSPGNPRHYYNPINYLGGPRFDSSDANERPTSIQSVLSID